MLFFSKPTIQSWHALRKISNTRWHIASIRVGTQNLRVPEFARSQRRKEIFPIPIPFWKARGPSRMNLQENRNLQLPESPKTKWKSEKHSESPKMYWKYQHLRDLSVGKKSVRSWYHFEKPEVHLEWIFKKLQLATSWKSENEVKVRKRSESPKMYWKYQNLRDLSVGKRPFWSRYHFEKPEVHLEWIFKKIATCNFMKVLKLSKSQKIWTRLWGCYDFSRLICKGVLPQSVRFFEASICKFHFPEGLGKNHVFL